MLRVNLPVDLRKAKRTYSKGLVIRADHLDLDSVQSCVLHGHTKQGVLIVMISGSEGVLVKHHHALFRIHRLGASTPLAKSGR